MNQDQKEFLQLLEKKEKESEEKLHEIAQATNPQKLFIAISTLLVIGPADQITESTHGQNFAKLELLAFHLYPYFENSDNNMELDPILVNECRRVLDNYFNSYMQGNFSRKTGEPEIVQNLISSTKLIRGAAYPEQTENALLEVPAKYDKWFSINLGISPSRAVEIIWEIAKTQERVVNDGLFNGVLDTGQKIKRNWSNANKKTEDDRTEDDKKLLEAYANEDEAYKWGCLESHSKRFSEEFPVNNSDLCEIDEPSKDEWQSLINLIGFTPAKRKQMDDPIIVKQNPLFIFQDGRVMVLDISTAFEELWNRFEDKAKSDQKFFQKYQNHRGKWLEKRVEENLLKIFPKENIYTQLSYPDPDGDENSTTELDAAVIWGPFLILIEAKASQFRLKSQLGDIGRLNDDLKNNIQDAFDQASRAATYIKETENPIFNEISSNRRLEINKNEIKQTFLLTISQQHLGGLATKLASLDEIGLFESGEYPISICDADFELITRFSDYPAIFLHYLERRQIVQQNISYIVPDEMEYFGAYLENRLFMDSITDQNKENFSHILLSGFTEDFDQLNKFERGELKIKPNIHLEIPSIIKSALKYLDNGNDTEDKLIAFTLLNLPDEIMSNLAEIFSTFRLDPPPLGGFQGTFMQSEDILFYIGAGSYISRSKFIERVKTNLDKQKTQNKIRKGIGFVFNVRNPNNPFISIVFEDG